MLTNPMLQGKRKQGDKQPGDQDQEEEEASASPPEPAEDRRAEAGREQGTEMFSQPIQTFSGEKIQKCTMSEEKCHFSMQINADMYYSGHLNDSTDIGKYPFIEKKPGAEYQPSPAPASAARPSVIQFNTNSGPRHPATSSASDQLLRSRCSPVISEMAPFTLPSPSYDICDRDPISHLLTMGSTAPFSIVSS